MRYIIYTNMVNSLAYIKRTFNICYCILFSDIVHRDIKLENILVANNPADPSDKYFIKLSDFGLSIVKTGAGIQGMLKEYCGTIIFMGITSDFIIVLE